MIRFRKGGGPLAGAVAAVLACAVLPAPAAGTPAALPDARTAGDAGGEDAGRERRVSVRDVTVPAADGTGLAATVYEPSGRGPHPLLVVPGPWIRLPLDHVTLVRRYRALARAGYVVVAYDPRGFRRSGGRVDLAGPADVADASRVLDWALAHTSADATRVGALGTSYGGTVALNAAAHDHRVRAVVALSAWAELAGGFRINGTRAAGVVRFQELFGRVDGRYGPEVEAAFDEAVTEDPEEPGAWVRERSPASHVAGLNRHRTAVFMVGEWEDPIVPAGQTGAFVDRLAGPSHLRMYRGGHADSHTAGTGLVDRPEAWEASVAWLDQYVRDRGQDGRDPQGGRGQRRWPAVALQPRTGGPLEEYAGWAALQEADRAVPLDGGRGSGRLVAGLPSPAESGPFPVAGPLDAVGGASVTSWPLLRPPTAAAYAGPPARWTVALRGHALIRGVLVPDGPEGTVVVHLYDIAPTGEARLLTHAPYSFTGRRPGGAHRFAVWLPATAWDVPAGHRLGVVFDTVDHRYLTENRVGRALEVVPGSVRLTAPLRDAREP
ncbi:CocE/NonD family hydrolase [Streptomyces kanasensis]|uniref:CocE/NonD family hydrolase n=1 Tax=Streptomyces kanasensis TaxID=936756 RepID=UPI003700EC5E